MHDPILMNDPIEYLSSREYAADADALKGLGALSVGAERLKTTCGTTYLRTLVTRAKESLASVSDITALGSAQAELYPHICEGVITDDVKSELATDRADRKRRALERNARSNFARTAYYTVCRYVGAGGSLVDINSATVTKSDLQAAADVLKKESQDRDAAAAPPIDGPATVRKSAVAEINEAYNVLVSAIARYPTNTPEDHEALDTIVRDIQDALCTTREAL